jgi:Ca2+-binding EF-hand superfamily protein
VIHERFPRWDADSDGHLSLPEATARLVKAGVPARGILPIVQRLDADHDGKLSERELLEMGKAVVESRDQDGDNRYSVAELLAWHRETGGDVQIKKAKSVFKNNDSDHDGFVTVPEMEAALSEILKSDH